MARDLDEGRGFLWWPVAMGAGAAGYFLLPFEPDARVVGFLALAVALAALAVRRWRGAVSFPLVLLVLAMGGVGFGKLAVAVADGPGLSRERSYAVAGIVLSVVDQGGRGHRVLLRPVTIEPMPRGGMPAALRISVRSKDAPPAPGQGLRLRARLGPASAPLLPGGYDFARAAFFRGIGGSGFALGAAEPWAGAPPPVGLDRWTIAVERFRQAVSRHIRATLPGTTGAIAAALIVGDRGAIDPDVDAAMRVSGLSHVLSISGLHMALVAACLFGGLRAALALFPVVALRWPVKKIAAGAALVATVAYFVISGMEVPAERSAIMIGTTLVAVILDRRALSLRVVAVAALVVLAVQPEAVLDPGAQMSFAAVVGLIAGFEAVAERLAPKDGGDVNPIIRAGEVALRWIGLSMLTSLIAGIATGPIALHHFNRVAPFGLVSNLLATPLVSFVIMPAALVASLLMPFGFDRWPLLVMGAGIDGMVRIAETVAAWTPGGGAFGQPRLAGTLLMVAGGLWLALWRGANRLIGLPAIALGLLVVLVPGPRGFDLIVAGDGRGALVTRADGSLALVGRPDDFEAGLWLAALGEARPATDPAFAVGTACDRDACLLWEDEDRRRARVSVVLQPPAFADECAGARLVVTPLPAPPWCRAQTTVVDAADVEGKGAQTFRLAGSDGTGPLTLVPIDAAISDADRPWMRR